MPAPTRDQVKPDVTHVIAVISGYDDHVVLAGDNPKDPKKSMSLETDLGMSADQRGAMAPGFKKIAQKWNPSASVSKTECKKLKTVTECIDLVLKRAGA